MLGSLGRYLGRGLRSRLPNSWDRNVDARDLKTKKRGSGEEGEKKERTVEAKLVFDINDKVQVQCKRSKQWNLKGIIKDVRINEQGTICSYLVQLESGLITSRHRCF